VKELVEKFEKEIRKDKIRRVQIRKEKEKEKMLNPETEVFKRSQLLEKYTAKTLFGWDNRKSENEYLKKWRKVRQDRKEKGGKFL